MERPNAPQTQSKSNLRYSNKEVEAANNGTAPKRTGAGETASEGPQPASGHLTAPKWQQVVAFDAKVPKTDAIQSSLGSSHLRNSNGGYDDGRSPGLISPNVAPGVAKFAREEPDHPAA